MKTKKCPECVGKTDFSIQVRTPSHVVDGRLKATPGDHLMDYQIAIEAGLDQIDACLRECAMTIHEISLKPPSEWNNEDWRIVIFSLHATAARAIYLQGEFLNGELEA